jgi:hypothetical protein
MPSMLHMIALYFVSIPFVALWINLVKIAMEMISGLILAMIGPIKHDD